ncbi:MAG TPA: long-chain-acyl-CoA synthetase [Myxococcales bacterium]|nr:long-chain-acyl-CoA synthetase [Myxococcales bacterium]
MSPEAAAGAGAFSVAAAWRRALELTAPIPRQPERVLPALLDELAEKYGDAPALLSDRERLTYRGLARRVNQYARWALGKGIARGDTVCLLMPNAPEYLAIWLGLTRVGAVVALLNTNLAGRSLAHCIEVVAPAHLIVSGDLLERVVAARPDPSPAVWVQGPDLEVDRYPGEALAGEERRPVTVEDRAIYMYTSGTTGLPGAAIITHGRLMQWSHWFAGLMDARPADRVYDCLPLYHSTGGLVAPGAMLVSGGSVVIRERFSASEFWSDVVRWECTIFQYVGELCRYLLHTGASAHEAEHRLRLACGNGLRPDVWKEFQRRFRIPRILEWYGAAEGSVTLFNVEGEPGAIGRVPSYLSHRFRVVLVRFDVDKDAPARNAQGFCTLCETNEVGEAISPLLRGPSNVASRFEGYADPKASGRKILHDVFEPGDAWFRTGDLMRRDERGFFWFVDRVGDTYRWKGENVATSEVEEALCAFPGVAHATAYGVAVPGTDGRAGMAALVFQGGPIEPRLAALRTHLRGRLPRAACPLFLRVRSEMEVTGTFKYRKADLVREGFDPAATADAIYFDEPDAQAFVRLDPAAYQRIQGREVRF